MLSSPGNKMRTPEAVAVIVLTASLFLQAKADVLDWIDPLIGTVGGGHVFPGATLPFGMAKAVADVNTELQGGFASDDGDITGFSHMHDSGTGGGASLGNFPLFPQTGCAGDELNNCYFTKTLRASRRIDGSVEARPGYFAVTLNTSIRAEMTASNHTALYRFTFWSGTALDSTGYSGSTRPFPNQAKWRNTTAPEIFHSPLILADLTDLSNSRMQGNISVDPMTGRITGSGTFRPSFGIGVYDLNFCADFSGARIRDSGIFQNNRASADFKNIRTYDDGVDADPPVPAGAWVQFHPPDSGGQILARVGLSFVSVNQACRNAETEIEGFDFDATYRAAQDAWRAKMDTVKIDATTVNQELQTVFWSGLYRTMISPQDYTGENPLWDSAEPYYDSYYCIWDSYRTIHPLITLVDPVSQTLMVRSLIDIYRHEGKLPDCRMSLCKGFTQGGSNADVVLADSYLKGLTDGIDWETGYEAVVSDAEDEPPIWSIEGRGGLLSWKTLGYIPTDDFDPYGVGPFTRSISRTLEYAYDDFCIAEMAGKMDHKTDAEKYLSRSGNWINMYREDQTSALNISDTNDTNLVDSGFTGFLQPRYLNGTWGFQDPSLCSPLYNFTSCYLSTTGHETYEGSSWLYTFHVPHDVARLITTLGGPGAFVRRLEYLHSTPGLLYFGDEQAFLLVYLFHYAGRPGLSSRWAHHYIPSQFNASTIGIPGNDDSGAMGSFSTLAMMGLFPMAGQDVYLLNAPFFREVSVTNALTGKTATIRGIGVDGGAYGNIYVQSATLDGEPYARSWIGHDFFRDGGVLELTLGSEESLWGTREEDLPPSASTHFWRR